MRLRRCLEDMDGSVEALVERSAGALVILIPSADGSHGCQGGGGPSQPTDLHIMDFLGANCTYHTRIHGLIIDHIDNANGR